jgi:hypothetical protein
MHELFFDIDISKVLLQKKEVKVRGRNYKKCQNLLSFEFYE